MSDNLIKKDQTLIVFDDGKRSRPSEGQVLKIISDSQILVKFKPWGYGEEVIPKETIFTKNKYNQYEAEINNFKFSNKQTEAPLNVGCDEYCLIDPDFSIPKDTPDWLHRIVTL
jgi:hypothetical protein